MIDSLKVEFSVGTSIQEAVTECCRIASLTDHEVRLVFNGIPLLINKLSCQISIEEQYDNFIKLNRETWKPKQPSRRRRSPR